MKITLKTLPQLMYLHINDSSICHEGKQRWPVVVCGTLKQSRTSLKSYVVSSLSPITSPSAHLRIEQVRKLTEEHAASLEAARSLEGTNKSLEGSFELYHNIPQLICPHQQSSPNLNPAKQVKLQLFYLTIKLWEVCTYLLH